MFSQKNVFTKIAPLPKNTFKAKNMFSPKNKQYFFKRKKQFLVIFHDISPIQIGSPVYFTKLLTKKVWKLHFSFYQLFD